MAKRNQGMSDTELSALLQSQIADAVAFDESELSDNREKALEYIDGKMDDTPAEQNKSSVVSYDVRDTIGWLLPGIMSVFLASDKVVDYEPETPDDEAFSAQATDYINYIFLRKCSGYSLLYSALTDGLALGNGVIKHYWDASPTYKIEEFTGLSEDQFIEMSADDDVEVLAHTEREETLPAELLPEEFEGEPPAIPVHDIKLKRTTATGSPKIEALPPEDFLIERAATVLDETVRFCAHVDTPTRSDLIKQGYKRELVDALPAWSGKSTDSLRDKLSIHSSEDDVDKSVEKVRIYECYVLADYDGDGIAERRMVVMGDRSDDAKTRSILKNEEWAGDLPFTDLVPDPVPHRWRGRSVFDKSSDVQRIKTVLQRQTLDNLYRVNNPQRQVLKGSVENMDALNNHEIGETIITNRPDAIRELTVPFVAEKALGTINYFDDVMAKRTGVSATSMGLDPEILQNQTAQAVADQRSASNSMVELYARNMAEVGLRRLFRCLLRMVVKHQDRVTMVRLRDKWVEMDPRSWNADMDATVNVGLGAGSRDRDMAMLQVIMNVQERIMKELGPENPLVGLPEVRNSFAKMIESAGMRMPEQFVKELPEGEQAKKPEKPDPKMQEAQMRLQLEQQKAAADIKLSGEKAQAESQLAMQKMEREFAMKDQQMEYEAQMREKQLQAEITLKREQMTAELEIKREMGFFGAATAATASLSKAQFGGEVG